MTTIDVETLKTAHRATWASGDYAAIAELIDDLPPELLIRRTGVEAGHRTLDVATGTGNVAVRTAALGSETVGLDLTPELLENARERASELGVEVEWVAGDAEALPFEDEAFDRVLSVFGVQFAPRHRVTADELVRVCAPGGTIGLANWTPESMIGELLKIVSGYLPAPPAYASSPILWGSEEHVRGLFSAHDVELEFERQSTPFVFDSAEHFVAFFETNYGPVLKARERLGGEGAWEDCRRDLVAMLERRNTVDDGLVVPSEYLVTVGQRPS